MPFYVTLDFDKFTHIYINLDLNEKVLPEMESFPLRHPCVNRFFPRATSYPSLEHAGVNVSGRVVFVLFSFLNQTRV